MGVEKLLNDVTKIIPLPEVSKIHEQDGERPHVCTSVSSMVMTAMDHWKIPMENNDSDQLRSELDIWYYGIKRSKAELVMGNVLTEGWVFQRVA